MRTLTLTLALGILVPGLTAVVTAPMALASGHAAGQAAYERGDFRTARTRLTGPAEAGEPQAQYLLGRMFANGDGVLQDYVQAHKWLNLASAGGASQARALRDQISARMTAGQLAESQALARQFVPKDSPAPARAAATAPRTTSPPAAASRPSATTAPRSTRAMVRDVQSMLAELGYDPGPADGLMGRRTGTAIRSYQLHSGLSVDGEPSEALASALRGDLGYPPPGGATDERPSMAATGGTGTTGSASSSAPPPPASTAPVYVQEAAAPRQSSEAAPAPRPDSSAEEPIARLRTLVEEARSRGAADRRFLEDLNDLLGRYDYPWRRVLVEDRFTDGDYTRGPSWQVLSGQFWVARGEGLRSQVQLASPPAAGTNQGSNSDSRKDLPLAILGALLNQAQRGQGGGSTGANAPANTDAEIVLASRIPESFAMEANLLSGAAEGRFELGVFQGGRADTGYRLAYLPGAAQALELTRVSGSQVSVIELYGKPLNLEDGRAHALLWTRDRDGRMRVSVDGTELLRVTDRRFSGSFDGLVVANRGGNYGLRDVRVLGE